MPKTVAVLVVRTTKVFAWLGHLPVMNWCLNQLREVRGVDTILCVATADLAARARDMLAKEDIETVVVPTAIVRRNDPASFERWLRGAGGPCAGAEVVLVCQPTLPFLPAGKLEACLEPVRRGFADTACTVRKFDKARTEHGQVVTYMETGGCRVFAPARVPEGAAGRFRPIPVGIIESLDLADNDNHLIAKALLADGSI